MYTGLPQLPVGSFTSEALFVKDERCQFLRRCANILSDIFSVFINIHEFPQCLDDVNVFSCPRHHQLGTLVQTVVKDFERLQDVSPVLALIVQALVEHIHNLVEVTGVVECQGSDFCHVCARRAPRVIRGSISHLDLDTAITLGDVLDAPDDFRHLDNGRSLQRRPAVDVRRELWAARWMGRI